jgi:FAD/FMN-containing dehydrogenase
VSVDDVVEGVTFARVHGLPLSVKGGGHGVAGNAVCDGGVMLDVSPMRAVRVDPAGQIAIAQAGVTLGDLDRETQAFGLATPTGVVSVTGLSGLALGGGLGWLNGKCGLTCDNVLAAEVVTATGERITADAEENPDLLWGLRGGGGNFGVATSFTLQLHPVDTVLAGRFAYPARKARAVLANYHEFTRGCPDALTTMASLSRTPERDVAVSVAVCYAGPIAKGDRLLRPLRALGPQSESIQSMSYGEWQHALDAGFPPGQQHYWKAGSLTVLDDAAIDVMLDFVTRMPASNSGVGLQQLHGAASRVDATTTAYPHRDERHDCLILSQWPDSTESRDNIAWTRDFFDAMRPFFSPGVYVNNLGDEGELRVKQAYGGNYDQLVTLKTKYDPTNLFRHNQNIKPLGATPG